MTIEPITNNSDIDVLPPARPAATEAIGQLMAHAAAMGAAKQLADALCASELVPEIYRGKPGNGAAAILYGAELGLNPIQSLQQIFVVHGQPAIYARTAVALLKRHGIIVETVSSADNAVTVRGTDPRTGQFEESTWTFERAQKAEYTKNKKYTTDPQGMLYAKAAMEVARKLAPDVLLGIAYAREELEMERLTQVRSERPERARGVAALAQRVAPTPEPAPTAAPEEVSPPSDPARKKSLAAMGRLLKRADVTTAEDGLIVTRALVGRDPAGAPITSSADLTDGEVDQLVADLAFLDNAGTLGGRVTDILNQHAIDQADAAEATA